MLGQLVFVVKIEQFFGSILLFNVHVGQTMNSLMRLLALCLTMRVTLSPATAPIFAFLAPKTALCDLLSTPVDRTIWVQDSCFLFNSVDAMAVCPYAGWTQFNKELVRMHPE